MILFSGAKVLLAKEELEDFSRFDTAYNYNSSVMERWLDKDGLLHREDGPATITTYEGEKREDWYSHGVKHRVGGPAFSSASYEGWMINGKLHREDGPAFISRGTPTYFLNGFLTSEAVVRALGKMK